MSKKLELYYFPACPYCHKVLDAADNLKIKLNLLNIREDSGALEKLVGDTGRKTVPCLYIDDKPMHESDDIVKWLCENVDNLTKVS